MRVEDLKTGFWGYQKFSVYQYIASLEETFSAKLLEKDEESRALLEKERQRVRELEGELKALRQAHEEQQNAQALIANTLLEAQRYAELLRGRSEKREEEARQQVEQALEQKNRELERYGARLQQLRGMFQSALRDMDGAAEKLADEIASARENAPNENLHLFRCDPECAD